MATALLADIRRPDDILDDTEVSELIDFSRPEGIVMTAVLHYLGDDEDPAGVVKAFMSAIPAGSHLVLSHYHPEGLTAVERTRTAEFAKAMGLTMAERGPDEIAALFGDLVLLEPGLVQPPEWHPDRPQREPTGWLLAGVARKP